MEQLKSREEYLALAAEAGERERESFERSDTDGCFSQWASSLTREEHRKNAEIAGNGGLAVFVGLYQGERRVRAKVIRMKSSYDGSIKREWELHPSETGLIAARGKRWLPYAGTRSLKSGSRVQVNLGLSERAEVAPAIAKIGGGGKGFAGMSSCVVSVVRRGDEWGGDARIAMESSVVGDEPGDET